MTGKENIQTQLKEFLHEGKQYANLQKELIQLIVAEKLSILLTKAFGALVAIILMAMIIFFPLMALAAWIGQLTTPAVGYLVVALLVLLILIIIYINRQKLIEEPITKTVTAIIAPEKSIEEAEEGNMAVDENELDNASH